jgi:hypothetical protein
MITNSSEDNFEILSSLCDAYEMGRRNMDKEELKEYLRNNLEIRVRTHNNGLHVELVLDDEVISTSGVALSQ